MKRHPRPAAVSAAPCPVREEGRTQPTPALKHDTPSATQDARDAPSRRRVRAACRRADVPAQRAKKDRRHATHGGAPHPCPRGRPDPALKHRTPSAEQDVRREDDTQRGAMSIPACPPIVAKHTLRHRACEVFVKHATERHGVLEEDIAQAEDDAEGTWGTAREEETKTEGATRQREKRDETRVGGKRDKEEGGGREGKGGEGEGRGEDGGEDKVNQDERDGEDVGSGECSDAVSTGRLRRREGLSPPPVLFAGEDSPDAPSAECLDAGELALDRRLLVL
ncbi:hypothetical protein C8J57DRAFT_1476862 [Mycena rebaudengoi]|nr:hypothetical protein C8J57DRAFT_1476862 [Mycena rebaudengoi]